MVDNKFKSGDKDVWQLNNGTFLALKTDRKTKKLKDEYRTKLFVDDIDTYTEKIIWQFCNEDSNFNFFNNGNEMMDEEDYFQVLLSGKIRGLEVEIYYRTPEIKRQLLKEAQAWQKEQNKSEKFSAE
jgi:hypothetical protein